MNRYFPISEVTRRLKNGAADVWKVHYEAAARLDAGEDILLLSVGDPDFRTPPDVARCLMEQIEYGNTHYSPAGGEPALLEALAKFESPVDDRTLSPANFTVFPGATAALYATLACIADPGDEIIVPEPMYIGYRSMFAALGIGLVTVPLLPGTFELPVDQIETLVSQRTRAVLVNTPGNPCGNVIDGERLARLSTLCEKRGLWMICDEVYSVFTYEGEHVSALRAGRSLDHVIIIDSLSKSHAMSGWRVGWAIAPETFTRTLHRYCSAAFFGCSQFVQLAAAYALGVSAPHILEMRNQYRARRDYVVQRIEKFEHLSCFPPAAGMFVMLDASRTGADGDTWARRLLDEAGIATIPGSGFGANTRDYVRLGLTHPLQVLVEAFDRIEGLGLDRP